MIANIINETLFGYRYDYDNCDPLINYVEAFNKVKKRTIPDQILILVNESSIISSYSILRYQIQMDSSHTHRKVLRYGQSCRIL